MNLLDKLFFLKSLWKINKKLSNLKITEFNSNLSSLSRWAWPTCRTLSREGRARRSGYWDREGQANREGQATKESCVAKLVELLSWPSDWVVELLSGSSDWVRWIAELSSELIGQTIECLVRLSGWEAKYQMAKWAKLLS